MAKVDVLSGYDKVNVIWSSRGRPVSSPGVTDSVTAYGRTDRLSLAHLSRSSHTKPG